MKTTIAIIGLCVVLLGNASAQTNQIATNATIKVAAIKPKPFVMPDTLVTKNGDTYQSVKLLQSDPSEITISYSDNENVVQIANVPLEDLPDDLKYHFGYDVKKAADFTAKQEAHEKLFANTSGGMSSAELRQYNYNSTIERRQNELQEQITQAEIAEKVRQEMLKERAVEAQEEAARAATIQATAPPAQTVIVY
jgi:hypothetical protein